jgi:hypothetical protein
VPQLYQRGSARQRGKVWQVCIVAFVLLDMRGAVARGQLRGLPGVRGRGFADPRSGGPRHLVEPPVGIACGDPGNLDENDRVPHVEFISHAVGSVARERGPS